MEDDCKFYKFMGCATTANRRGIAWRRGKEIYCSRYHFSKIKNLENLLYKADNSMIFRLGNVLFKFHPFN